MTTDQRLVDYVLGSLPEAEAERLDEASIVDDGMAARLRAIEDDLVDAYVRGRLSGVTLQRFERHYLASAHRRKKVEFARRFTNAVDRASTSSPVTPVPLLSSRSVWKLTAIAASLLVASVGLVMQTARVRSGMAVVQQERQALDRRAQDLHEETSDLRAAREIAAHAPERPRPTPEAPAIALLLFPQTREAGPVPAVVLPARATRITLELQLESAEPAAYQIGLRDPAVNQIVWRSAWTASAGRSLTVSVPASLLKPQHYSLDLSARQASGDVELVGSYAFEIASR